MINRHFLLGIAVLMMLHSSLSAAGNLVDGDDADLIYDPVTGNVQLDASDVPSTLLISFVFVTDQNSFRPENFVESSPGNPGPFLNVGTNTDATTFQIGQTDPLGGAGWRNNPNGDMGDIFPPGMNQLELSEYLTLAEYASDLASGGMFDLVVVPEPSALSLVFVALMLMARRSGRESSC